MATFDFWKRAVDAIPLRSSRLRFSLGQLKLFLKFCESTKHCCSEKSAHWLFLIGLTHTLSSWLKLSVPKTVSLDFFVRVNQSLGRVDSSSASLKPNFCLLCTSRPGMSKGRLEPYAKIEMYAKIDSISIKVILTLLIKSYKYIYSINKLNLTLLSRFKPIKHI